MGYKIDEYWVAKVSTPIGDQVIEKGTKQECQMAAMMYKMNNPGVVVNVNKVDVYSM